jgi:hypothetical protein
MCKVQDEEEGLTTPKIVGKKKERAVRNLEC